MPLLNERQVFFMKASVLVRIVAQSADVAHFVHAVDTPLCLHERLEATIRIRRVLARQIARDGIWGLYRVAVSSRNGIRIRFMRQQIMRATYASTTDASTTFDSMAQSVHTFTHPVWMLAPASRFRFYVDEIRPESERPTRFAK